MIMRRNKNNKISIAVGIFFEATPCHCDQLLRDVNEKLERQKYSSKRVKSQFEAAEWSLLLRKYDIQKFWSVGYKSVTLFYL